MVSFSYFVPAHIFPPHIHTHSGVQHLSKYTLAQFEVENREEMSLNACYKILYFLDQMYILSFI